MRRLVILLTALAVSCGGCGDDNSSTDNGAANSGTNNNQVVEPYVAEQCDSDEDADEDGLAACADPDCRLAEPCTFEPADPAETAIRLPSTGVTGFYDRMSFLFEGDDPIQRGVEPGSIGTTTIGAASALVRDPSGQPVAGAAVTIAGKPEFGRTYSRGDGRFDLAFDAGSDLVIRVEKSGYTPVYRTVSTKWQDAEVLDDVVLTPIESNATVVDFLRTTFVEGTVAEDDSGVRRTNLVVPAGVEAKMVMPNGARRPLPVMTVRVTEVTVGEDGPNAMPGRLPGTSQYTFAAHFAVDEAEDAGAEHVEFDSPVYAYVDNFIGFPPGSVVPNGWFDQANPSWKGSANGVVLRISEVEDGKVSFDGGAAGAGALSDLGISDAEREVLAEHYEAGDEVWRVPLRHFSSRDFNWAGDFPDGIFPPPEGGEQDRATCGGPVESGSIIHCHSQTLGERIRLNGTPLTLAYQSGRVPRRLPSVTIPLHDGNISEMLKRIEVTMDVAGVRFEEEYAVNDPGELPSVQVWEWDRVDGFGRFVQGAVPAEIVVTYVYQTSYEAPIIVRGSGLGPTGTVRQPLDDEDSGDFAQYTTSDGTTVQVGRSTMEVSRSRVIPLGGWDVSREDLGGWTLAPQHRFDPNVPALHFGGGADLVARDEDRTLELLVGQFPHDGQVGPSPDGTPADEALVGPLGDIAVGRDGSVYFVESIFPGSVRRISPAGILETVAGGEPSEEEAGDGQPAIAAHFETVGEVQVGPDGLLYVASRTAIWQVDDDGIIRRVAGGGDIHLADAPRGTRARDLRIRDAAGMTFDVGRDGSIYFAESGQVYRTMPGGRTYDIAGAPEGESCPSICGDGEPAANVPLGIIDRLRVLFDGTIVFVEDVSPNDGAERYDALRRIETDGTVRTFPQFRLGGVSDLQVHPISDELYVAPEGGPEVAGVAVYRVDDEGRIEPHVGSSVDPESLRGSFSREVVDGSAARTPLNDFARLAVSPRGEVVFTNTYQLVRMRELLPTWTGAPYQIPSVDGSQVFEFFADGRHDKTRDALTGALIWDFRYDDTGRLEEVVDAEGDSTTIGRDADGRIASITGPESVTWEVETDAGYMTTLTSPEGETWTFDYTPGGLLTQMTAPTSDSWVFEYDDKGRLVRDEQATLSREFDDSEQTVTYTSAEGRQTQYTKSLLRTSRSQQTGNVQSSTELLDDGLFQQELPDGTLVLSETSSHPALGYIAGYTSYLGVYTPGGASFEVTREQTAELAGEDLFGLEDWQQIAESGDQRITSGWNAASRTLRAESREGRAVSLVLDELARPTQYTVLGRAPYELAYDDSGRIVEVSQSGRTLTVSYDANGYPSAVETSDGTVQFSRDTMGRMTRGTRTDMSTIDVSWDGMSNPVNIAPPQRPDYVTQFNKRQQPTSFETPSGEYTFGYNDDYQVDELTYPDGRTATVSYDANGRPVLLAEPGRQVDLAFDDGEPGQFDGSNRLLAAQSDTGVDVELAWDGILFTDVEWVGEVSGNVSAAYGEQMFLDGISVNGVDVPYEYDRDGAVSKAGDQIIKYVDGTFQVSRRKLGGVTTDMEYDAYGQLTNLHTRASGNLLELSYTYDDLGRITQIVENDQGTERTLDYEYDLLGQLTEVRTDGVVTGQYTYDANGNRTSSLDVATADYRDDDALMTYGSRTYAYSSGQLATMTEGGTTTTYDYGMFGELRSVDDGTTTIEYVHDAFNRRVGKRVDGTLVQGFLYQGALNPIAELKPDGSVKSRFVYATRPHVPDFMIRDGRKYALVTDHLGSVRYVVDTDDGSIAQRLEYDEFGRVLSDSNPGFQPFGFAGGLYDPDTGLVRFGMRDYDPLVGRWTAIDPIGFGGGQANLWVYLDNGPVSRIDPSGTSQLKLRERVLLTGLGGAFLNSTFNAIGEVINGQERYVKAAAIGVVPGAVGAVIGLAGPPGILVGGAIGAGLNEAGYILFGLTETDDPWGRISSSAAEGAVLACGGGALGYLAGGGAMAQALSAESLVAGLGLFIREAWEFDRAVVGHDVNER